MTVIVARGSVLTRASAGCEIGGVHGGNAGGVEDLRSCVERFTEDVVSIDLQPMGEGMSEIHLQAVVVGLGGVVTDVDLAASGVESRSIGEVVVLL